MSGPQEWTDLLHIRWWECGAPELLERLLHKEYDPLFPDEVITHVKILFSAKKQLAGLSNEEKNRAKEREKNVVQRALFIEERQKSLSKEDFDAWLKEKPELSERNAERYVKLARWSRGEQ